MPRLRDAEDFVFVAANQRVNQAVHNPWITALSNVGPLGLVVAAILQLVNPFSALALVLTLAGLGLYAVTLAATLAINVPMNNKLIRLGSRADAASLAEARSGFEKPWTRMNTIRTWTTAGAGVLTLVAVLEVLL